MFVGIGVSVGTAVFVGTGVLVGIGVKVGSGVNVAVLVIVGVLVGITGGFFIVSTIAQTMIAKNGSRIILTTIMMIFSHFGSFFFFFFCCGCGPGCGCDGISTTSY